MADEMTAGLRVDEPEQRKQVRRAVIASTVGTSIEWYDFFLYGTIAALAFPKLFFPTSSPYVGTLESFATFFVGFAAGRSAPGSSGTSATVSGASRH